MHAALAALPFPVPQHACDCHTHIFGDYPMVPDRRYTPGPALPEAMAAMHRALGIERVVIVTPSVYGSDNASTLDGIAARGKSARGVAVISEQTGRPELEALHAKGIRGIRLNLTQGGVNDPVVAAARFRWASEQVAGFGWHVQMLTSPDVIAALVDLFAASPVPVVFDHFGGATSREQAGFGDLVRLVGSGKAYVKVSRPPAGRVTPMAQALIRANPERVLWGTDWPHPAPNSTTPLAVTPFQKTDDLALLAKLGEWAPQAPVREQILVHNPARLYGF